LNPYYDIYEGWSRDKRSHIIDLLKRVRFFNRFDDEALKMMLTKVTFKRIEKNSVFSLKGPEAAILISGQLTLLSHDEDLENPYIACTYNPGDVIGIPVDNGWHNAK
jgi:hypothetical protein